MLPLRGIPRGLWLVLLVLFVVQVDCVQKVFIATTGNNVWESDSNWNPAGVPTSSDDVYPDTKLAEMKMP